VGYCKTKTRYAAEKDIEAFLRRNNGETWFYTFTEPSRSDGEQYWSKSQAERALKPFTDLLRRSNTSGCAGKVRRKVEYLVFWEKQQRGSWHPHILLNKRFDVNWLRAWMVERGWGVQMKFKYIPRADYRIPDDRHPFLMDQFRLRKYLIKYLTKARCDEPKKKFFGGNGKESTTNFRWAPWYDPSAMLFHYGRLQFVEMNGGQVPTAGEVWRNMSYIIRLGVEATDWLSVDPWWMPSG
jgi:hypothetical protein